jgi:RNA polymerase sigma-70 factor (ECF subfamily)
LEEIKQAFAELPELFRIPVLLSDVEGLKYREIAEVLSVPIGTVMSRLSRGRQMLRDRLASASARLGENSKVEKGKKSGQL